MPGHSRPKDGVALLAYVPGIHAFTGLAPGVDGRDKPGHDGAMSAVLVTVMSIPMIMRMPMFVRMSVMMQMGLSARQPRVLAEHQ